MFMLERCLEICRWKIRIKQMHKASIAVEDADMTRAGYGQAIEMYSVIDVTANDLRYETVEGLKQIQADSLDEIFAILMQKIDPSSGKNRMESVQIDEMK